MPTPPASFKDYIELCKPRVVALMLLTVLVGMYLAPDHSSFSWITCLTTLGGIASAASAAAALNHCLDRHRDARMKRTQQRPMVHGKISVRQAILFSLGLGFSGLLLLYYTVNPLTAYLTFLTIIGYAGIYTCYLKHATPQNIVIGGLAGAAPPLLGWVAVTGHLAPQACLLVLIIYTWTPPHFWALSIYRYEDYRSIDIPMLPITHGIPFTKFNIVLYTLLLSLTTLLPYCIGMSGILYAIGTFLLNLQFIFYTMRLYRSVNSKIALKTFKFSILYLMLLFILLLLDHQVMFI